MIKGSLVIANPQNTSVHFSDTFNGIFTCQAKENVTLKFRKIQKFKRVSNSVNKETEYPYQAMVNFNRTDLMDGSVISCTTITGTILHSWTVSFSERNFLSTFTQFCLKELLMTDFLWQLRGRFRNHQILL